MGRMSRGDPETWTSAEAERLDLAQSILRALIAAYTARIEVADPSTVRSLHIDRSRYAGELRALDANDGAALDRILTEYPSIIRRVRGG